VYEAHVVVGGEPVPIELDKSFAITGTASGPTGGAPKREAPAA
jgi:hypothetical protein